MNGPHLYLPAPVFAWILVGGWLAGGSGGARAQEDLPPLGHNEKIRLGWTQWQWFQDYERLIDNLQIVGTNVFADWSPSPDRGRYAKRHGMRYYAVIASAKMRGPAESQKARLAVDRFGLTCPEQFEAYKAGGGDVAQPWGKYGEHTPAYVPCPLEPGPWQATMFDLALRGATAGWLDGISLDMEPYGAYAFDHNGETLCYCDDCFAQYAAAKKIKPSLERPQRHGWLNDKNLLDDYLRFTRQRQIDMFRQLAEPVWKIRPAFGFGMYPDFSVEDLRADWKLQGIALGLHRPRSPFLVVNSTPYWEDFKRPWWEIPHESYRKLGFKHVLGSWDMMMGGYPFYVVDNVQTNYEFAMASDGYWRWGEREFLPQDWRSFAAVNRRLRQVESRLGDFILRGEVESHFVTLVEETGNPWIERMLLTRTFKQGHRYLTRVNNGHADWPAKIRLRFPRPPMDGAWELTDPLHDVGFATVGGATSWTATDLRAGLVVTIEPRGELFVLLQPATNRQHRDATMSVRSLEIPVHRLPPENISPLTISAPAAHADWIAYTRSASGGYNGATAGQGLVTALKIVDATSGQSVAGFQLQGDCRQPVFSADGSKLAFSTWVNGKGQIYVIDMAKGQVRNVSNNEFREHSPAFAPDGGQLAFVSDEHGDWDLYTMQVDGSRRKRLTDAPGVDRSPNWSPGGQQIAFISNRNGDFDVFVMDSDGRHQRALVRRDGNEYQPVWSPDGRRIACTTQYRWNRCIQICRADGSDRHFIGLGPFTDLWSIGFSPDGQTMAAAYTKFGEAGLTLIDCQARVMSGQQDWEGEKIKKLQTFEPIKPHPNGWYTSGTAQPRWVVKTIGDVKFSPDGKHLVYSVDATDDGSFQLFSLPLDGDLATPISGTRSAWPSAISWTRRNADDPGQR